jgi:hypothetical protein
VELYRICHVLSGLYTVIADMGSESKHRDSQCEICLLWLFLKGRPGSFFFVVGIVQYNFWIYTIMTIGLAFSSGKLNLDNFLSLMSNKMAEKDTKEEILKVCAFFKLILSTFSDDAVITISLFKALDPLLNPY